VGAYKYKKNKIYTTAEDMKKYDDLGDGLYYKLMIKNAGTLIKAVLGDKSGMDKLLDEMFYEYND